MNNEIALVTGASRGIGLAIATKLAQQGATVIGTATSESGREKIQQTLQDINSHCAGLVMDIADSESVTTAIQQLNDSHGAPTILVNNAGITRDQLLMRMSDDDWETVVNTNLNGAYRVTRQCLRGMIKNRKGRIISIASVVGAAGNAGQANYCASKAALGGFSKALAKEVGSRGVTVNVVAPGFIDTDMTRALSDDQREKLAAQIPLGHLGDAEDIAAAVAFLASAAARYITGETLHVNGGMYMN